MLTTVFREKKKKKKRLDEATYLGTIPELPANNGNNENRNANIGRNKIRRVPVSLEENGKSCNQRNYGRHDKAKPCGIRLQRCLPRERFSADILLLHCSIEADIAETKRCPGNETGDGAEIQKPGESLRCTTGSKTQIRQGSEEPSGDDSHVWHAILIHTPEELGQLVVCSHGDDHAGADPTVGITGRPRSDEDACIYNGGQRGDASVLDGDHEWRAVCVVRAGDKV